MNPIYHALSKYKNWQRHISLATIRSSYSSHAGSSYLWDVKSELTFYFDGRFKSKKIKTITVRNQRLRHTYDWEAQKFTQKTHDEMCQMLQAVQSLPECSPTDSLLAEAKECLLLDNPPRTGLLLVKLIEGWEKK